jgi:AbrB family looped-hinge helix DNA binding protein
MEYAIAKVSTKGQIVIPKNLREDINAGDQFLIIKDGERIVLKNMAGLASNIKDDIVFAERVEQSWFDHGMGEFETKTKDQFLKELEKC